MPCKNYMLFFVVTATLASLNCFNGLSIDAGAFVQRPTLQGRVYFRSVVSDDESVVPTRYGSLAFRDGDQKLTPALHSLMESKLKRLDPIVQCSDNLMTLKVKRAGAPHVLVNNGVGLLTPLTQMPSSCGLSVKRSRRDVLFSAPYQGCHVTQQGGDYVLPLRLWGAPMAMSCPAVLPPPSVSCFPTGMVVKVGGITANGLRVKVSGAWMSLSSVCGSCGFAVEATSEGLTLTAPYNIGLCIEIKDEKHLLSLLMVDVELLVTCPSLPDIKPTTTTTTTMPPSDSGQVLQFPQFHQFPMFQQYPVLPLPSYQANTPSPTPGTVAPLSQQPQIPSGPNNEHQGAPADQHPSFPFMQQYPQLPQYVFFPGPVPPTQATPTKNTAAAATTTEAKLPQLPQFPSGPAAESGPNNENQGAPAGQHPSFPFMQQYPQLPQYVFFPRRVPPTQTTPTKNTAADTEAQLPSGPAAELGPKNQGAPAGQHPLFPFMQQYPQLPQYIFFPGPVPPTQATPTKNAAAAATTTEAKLPSGPAAESGPKNKNQGAPAGQHPSFPFMQHYPQLPQYVFFPGPVPPTQATPTKNAAAAATTTEAKLPQLPQFASGPAAESGPNNENQGAPAGQHPSFPFMQQYPQLPQYVFFPGPVPPTQTTPTKNTAADTEAQLPSGPAAELGPKNKNQGAPAGQHPSFPFMQQYPQLPQYVFFPGPVPPTQATPTKNTAAAATNTEAKLPQLPQFASGPAAESGPNNENQGAPAGQHPSFPFMQQYPQLPQYVFFPGPVPPTQTTPTKNTAADTEAQLPSGPAAELGPKNKNQGAPAGQHPSFPFMQQYPQLPQYVFFPGPVPPTQATPTKNTAAAATTTEAKLPQMPQFQQLPQFLVPPQYNFLTFPKLPLSPEGQPQAIPNPKPLIQQPKPQPVYPQVYQMPVLYPPQRYPSQIKNSAATTPKPAVQKPFPHPYMPLYYAPQQAPMPVFPDPSTTPPTNPALFDQQRQPMYRAMPLFYPFPPHQTPTKN